ncbi:uncharacterized protein F5Z01DRAFT_636080 [Emericellopsis atlantica]|uniref:Uncharacterized protein n=1 Tax=Emericellopsis atlantica TaxID=2614577 RepID=A0A9P8CPV4_9HYPO|nr:uncharacterized protein F5Z01DRAFT_636080 [Emericellopsis atlantica]KAG9254592.1 hypothetical protein F5Z01DRAFT_636080 [Emericellopsis atlantica]
MKPSHFLQSTAISRNSVEAIASRSQGVENIDDKVSAMLAAAHVLRPATEVGPSQGFKVSRIVEGVSHAMKVGARSTEAGRNVSLDQHLAASLTKPIEKMHLGYKGNARRERVQRIGGGKSNVAFAPILIDPFSTEEGFEDDLDCGVLFTPPEGCSTPRLFGRGRPPRRSRHSEDSDDVEGNGKRGKLPANTRHPAGDDTPNDFKRVKKHPSPDKLFLKSLELALEKYNKMKVDGAAEDDLDELASNFNSPTRPLAVRDSNRILHSEAIPSKQSRNEGKQDLPRKPHRMRQPHEHDNLQYEKRPICLFRPKDAQADEMDELF